MSHREWMSLKTFRKLAATHAVESTGNMRVARMLLGRTSVRTTEMYLGREDGARARGVEAMAGYLGKVV
jgi:site-specific recombinase XerD